MNVRSVLQTEAQSAANALHSRCLELNEPKRGGPFVILWSPSLVIGGHRFWGGGHCY